MEVVVAWIQRVITLPQFGKGCHSVTNLVASALPELSGLRAGILHVFLQHTSASLTINENADPDVLVDLDRALDNVAPEDLPYRHQEEGPDDMPAHVKSTVVGASLTIPVSDGRLNLGAWQGICLCEHRRRAPRRRLVLTLTGE